MCYGENYVGVSSGALLFDSQRTGVGSLVLVNIFELKH